MGGGESETFIRLINGGLIYRGFGNCEMHNEYVLSLIFLYSNRLSPCIASNVISTEVQTQIFEIVLFHCLDEAKSCLCETKNQ